MRRSTLHIFFVLFAAAIAGASAAPARNASAGALAPEALLHTQEDKITMMIEGKLRSPRPEGIVSTDLNGNGIMDLPDFAIFAALFTAGLPAPAADFDCSGGPPNLPDFAIFAAAFASGIVFVAPC
jgi:hypothetical protein